MLSLSTKSYVHRIEEKIVRRMHVVKQQSTNVEMKKQKNELDPQKLEIDSNKTNKIESFRIRSFMGISAIEYEKQMLL